MLVKLTKLFEAIECAGCHSDDTPELLGYTCSTRNQAKKWLSSWDQSIFVVAAVVDVAVADVVVGVNVHEEGEKAGNEFTVVVVVVVNAKCMLLNLPRANISSWFNTFKKKHFFECFMIISFVTEGKRVF